MLTEKAKASLQSSRSEGVRQGVGGGQDQRWFRENFSYFSVKTYCETSLELSQQDISNEG